MNGSRFLALVTGALLLLVSCTPAPQKGTVTITTHINFTIEPYRGTFAVVEGSSILGCERGSFVDRPRGSYILKEMTCEAGGRSGTFAIQFTPPDSSPWTVKDAGGDFTGLSGGGNFSLVPDDGGESGVETFIGEIQFSP